MISQVLQTKKLNNQYLILPAMDHDYQEREAFAVRALKDAIPKSLKKNLVPSSEGMFAELYENDEVFPGWFMATATDTAGTKVILAQAMDKFDTIGIDLVAMSANDLACYGKIAPYMFLNTLACQEKIEEEYLIQGPRCQVETRFG